MAEEKRRDKELYFICGYDTLNHLLEQETRQGEDPITIMIIIGLAVAAALGTTGCGAEFDEENRVPLPTTFSDYEYEHDLNEYNSKEYKMYTSCYAYALGIVVDPNTNKKFGKHDGSDKWAAQPAKKKESGEQKKAEVIENGGITEEEAVEIAGEWLIKLYGVTEEGLEIDRYFSSDAPVEGQ